MYSKVSAKGFSAFGIRRQWMRSEQQKQGAITTTRNSPVPALLPSPKCQHAVTDLPHESSNVTSEGNNV